MGEAKPIEFVIGNSSTKINLTVANELDSSPRGSVAVTKKDADNPDILLSDAEFYLYVMAEDGKWHHYKERTYKTGEDGKLTVEKLPFGTYCFKEVKAPEGYKLNDKTEYRFTVGSKAVVEIEITNKRISEGAEPEPEPKPEPDSDPEPVPDNIPSAEEEKLPQTGQGWLMVVLLAAGGMVLVAFGKYLKYHK